MSQGFMQLAEQCCDADSYLNRGYRCATAGECVDGLRPIGSSYWFGVPFYFDAKQPTEVLFWLQIAMLLGLVLVSFFVFRGVIHRLSDTRTRCDVVGLSSWFIAMGAWVVYLSPTFFNTLSDNPASMLFVGGFLVLIAAAFRDNAVCYLSGGLLLGLSALMKSSYFNPVILGIFCFSVFLIFISFKKSIIFLKNYKKVILVFSFFIPVCAQYLSNYKNYDSFSFVTPAYSRLAMNFHLESAAGGYDTLLPQNAYSWSPVCDNAMGLKKDLMSGNFFGAFCIFENRLRFYMGSYSAKTYLGERDRDFLDYGVAEQVGTAGPYGVEGIKVNLSSAMSPVRTKTASRLEPSVVAGDNQASYVEISSLMPLAEGNYTASIWLWSDDENAAPSLKVHNFSIANKGMEENVPLLERKLSLNRVPRKFLFTFTNARIGYLKLQFGYFDSSNKVLRLPFYAWGVKLEPAKQALGYISKPVSSLGLVGLSEFPAQARVFSWWMFVANIISLLLALAMLWVCWRKTQSPIVIFIAGCFLGVLAQSLLVIPEQRFVQSVLMTSWFLGCLLVSYLLRIVLASLHIVKSR